MTQHLRLSRETPETVRARWRLETILEVLPSRPAESNEVFYVTLTFTLSSPSPHKCTTHTVNTVNKIH